MPTVIPLAIQTYTATLTSVGSANPTVNILHDTLDGDIVWVRTGLGIYTGTLAGAFTPNKIGLFVTSGDQFRLQWLIRTSADVITLIQKATNFAVTDALLNTVIEIRKYK